MSRPLPAFRSLLLAALLAAAAQPGCVTTPRPPAVPLAVSETFRSSFKNARAEGQREVEDIVGVYVNLPAEQGPGIAALRRDVAEALARMKREGRDRLGTEEVDRLTIGNPSFWNAWFEFDPRDSSLLMLHASLLMEAGELLRASLVLTIGVQTLPLNVQERMFWFTQQAQTHWTVFRRLDELRELEKSWGESRRRREAGLTRALADWPGDGLTLEALLQSRAGLKPGTIPTKDNAPIPLSPKMRQRVAKELAQLRRTNPVAAARYAENQEAAAEFGRLWTRLTDETRAVENREVMQFAEQARRLGLAEIAMVASRALAAKRGFRAPGDLELIRHCLYQLLPPADAARLLHRIQEGALPGFVLTREVEAPHEVLQGMDPHVHPLLADHAVREFARETLWITASADNAELRAEHLRARALGSSNVGCFAGALDDLNDAIAIRPSATPWLIDRAVILSKMGRSAEADIAFAEAGKQAPKDDFLRSSLAVHRYCEGRYAEAEELFRAAPAGTANFDYEVIFAYLAGLRRGAPDRAWLQQNRLKKPAWPAAIQRHLVGEIDRATLLQAARDTFDLRTTEQQCEAYFALGQIALAAGDQETAQRELENCIHSGIVGFIEYDLARRDLARLKPPPAPALADPGVAPAKPVLTPAPTKDGASADAV